MPLAGVKLRRYPREQMNPKQRAAEASLNYVTSNSIVGLGTGSTAEFFIQALAQALRDGRLKNIRGVPTSNRSEQLAQELGVPVTTLAQSPQIDVTVDGADEIAPNLNLIKGLGGALLREKIVAQNSTRLVIIADATKVVDVLGTKGPLPVEVAVFAHEAQERFLKSFGAAPSLRMKDAKPYVTDNGNYIYDCKFPSIPDPQILETALARRAGVVESGLFLGMATIALIGNENSVRTLTRK
jgi:ribose 5-phosphate isomerase A